MHAPLTLTRAQILAFRRATQHLDRRLPFAPASLREAALAGLQDSMPRAALLSLHARVVDVTADAWQHASFVQLWGPRYHVYVVPARDRALFTLGRLPSAERAVQRAASLAQRLRAGLGRRRMRHGEIAARLGVDPNLLRYAATTGRVQVFWDGARQPDLWTVPAPAMTAVRARSALARRFLHVFGPSTSASFARWAGLPPADAARAFATLGAGLIPVRTPLGEAWLLAEDEALARQPVPPSAPARLLPSGDAFFLAWDVDRAVLVPDARQRASLWTARVWPGALLVDGEIAGTWRRTGADVSVSPWRRLTPSQRAALDAEIAALPLASP